jgi:arylsulfatase A-like enzyme
MSERPARDTLAAALAYIEDQPRRKPFFVWIHLIDPHGPYAAPAEPDRFVGDAHAKPAARAAARRRRTSASATSRSTRSWTARPTPTTTSRATTPRSATPDDALAAFFARLRELGLYDHTLFVVTADHGETLDEPTHHRYFAHEFLTYEEDARIPLIVREPVGVRRVAALDPDALVLSIDVAPTLLDRLGAEIPRSSRAGASCARARARRSGVLARLVRLARREDDRHAARGGARSVALPDQHEGRRGGALRPASDPHETQNVARRHPDELAELRRALADFMAKPGRRNRLSDLSPEDRERLRALGYVR